MYHVDLELDALVKSAIEERASDIHLRSVEWGMQVYFRIDGLLEKWSQVSAPYHEKVINRIKVLSSMDISEKRLPQDGRWEWSDDKNSMIMRVSILPTNKGETVVCRLLRNEGALLTLQELGMEDSVRVLVEKVLAEPAGLLLISGTTGSGKTSTLYALLRLLSQRKENLISLEDPIEADIEGAVQVQVNERVGLSFANGLRAILRQDPDTIMVGEIRDAETAQLAVQAALTGHRVLATIHTKSAMATKERLLDMGVENYLVEATLRGALAQRLVRRSIKGKLMGRLAIYELFLKDGPMEQSICTLQESARRAVQRGDTTEEEIRRLGLEGGEG